jgi:5-oxoprolinase (ATP-hydrolysing)
MRRIRFLERMTASILSGHRRIPPHGLAGGLAGAPGGNWIERTDGTRVNLAASDKAELVPGDVFVVETPGGGGFGTPTGITRGGGQSSTAA